MPHTFWHAGHHPWNVGQDGILRAGCQPARAACLQAILAGYQLAAGCKPAPQEHKPLRTNVGQTLSSVNLAI
jgi:hypothetical protein